MRFLKRAFKKLASKGKDEAIEAIEKKFVHPRQGVQAIAPFVGRAIGNRLSGSTSHFKVVLLATVLEELMELVAAHAKLPLEDLAKAMRKAATNLADKGKRSQHERD